MVVHKIMSIHHKKISHNHMTHAFRGNLRPKFYEKRKLPFFTKRAESNDYRKHYKSVFVYLN